MENKKLLFSALVTSTILLLLHLWALKNFLYWRYWWFDNITHLLGGFVIATLILFSFDKFFDLQNINWKRAQLITILSAFLVSVLWEIFEYKAGAIFPTENYATDIFFDITMGLFGALFGGFYYHLLLKKINLLNFFDNSFESFRVFLRQLREDFSV